MTILRWNNLWCSTISVKQSTLTQQYSGSSFSVLLNSEATIFEGKHWAVVFHQDRKNLLSFIWIFATASVDEDVLLPVVPVNVTAEPQLSFLLGLLDDVLGEEDRRVWFLRWFNPLTVQISTRQIASIVANNNPVNVEHGNNFKYEIFFISSKLRRYGNFMILQQAW